jgi:hypothetical protein
LRRHPGDFDPATEAYAALQNDCVELRMQAAAWYDRAKKSRIPALLADAIISAIFGLLLDPEVPVSMRFYLSVVTDLALSRITSVELVDLLIKARGYQQGNYHVYLHEIRS